MEGKAERGWQWDEQRGVQWDVQRGGEQWDEQGQWGSVYAGAPVCCCNDPSLSLPSSDDCCDPAPPAWPVGSEEADGGQEKDIVPCDIPYKLTTLDGVVRAI